MLLLFFLASSCFGQVKKQEQATKIPHSPATAVIFSVFIPGGGHFYNENYGTGSIYLFSEVLFLTGSLGLTVKSSSSGDNIDVATPAVNGVGLASLFVFATIKIIDVAHAGMAAADIRDKAGKISVLPSYYPDKQTTGLTLSYNF